MTTKRMQILKYKEEEYLPQDEDPEIDELLKPARQFPQVKVSFEMKGVHISVISTLRSMMISQINVKALDIDVDTYSSGNYEFLDFDFVRNVIRMIPVLQDIPEDAEFYLDAKNNTPLTRNVLSSEIKQKSGKKGMYFPQNIAIGFIGPGAKLEIGKIFTVEGRGYFEKDHGGFKIAHQVYHVPLDVEMYDEYTRTGESSSISNPLHHKFGFISEGFEPPKSIIIRACRELRRRMTAVSEMAFSIQRTNDYYTLKISNEADAIGNIICCFAYVLYPDNEGWSYGLDDINDFLTINMRGDDVQDMFQSIITHCNGIFDDIEQIFEAM